MGSTMEGVHWAPVAAVLVCGSCLSSLAGGLSAVAGGFVGSFWAAWSPAVVLLAVGAAWIGGLFAAPRRQLRCERS